MLYTYLPERLFSSRCLDAFRLRKAAHKRSVSSLELSLQSPFYPLNAPHTVKLVPRPGHLFVAGQHNEMAENESTLFFATFWRHKCWIWNIFCK